MHFLRPSFTVLHTPSPLRPLLLSVLLQGPKLYFVRRSYAELFWVNKRVFDSHTDGQRSGCLHADVNSLRLPAVYWTRIYVFYVYKMRYIQVADPEGRAGEGATPPNSWRHDGLKKSCDSCCLRDSVFRRWQWLNLSRIHHEGRQYSVPSSAGTPAPLIEQQSAWNAKLGRRTRGLAGSFKCRSKHSDWLENAPKYAFWDLKIKISGARPLPNGEEDTGRHSPHLTIILWASTALYSCVFSCARPAPQTLCPKRNPGSVTGTVFIVQKVANL